MFKTISLFSGIGGLDFGFEEAGFETRVALEFDKFCCNAMRLNRPHWGVIEGDVNHVSSADILKTAGLKKGEADVLIGGPPCQPFSKSGYWARGDSLRLDDPRANTLTAYLRILRDTKPKVFLLENVYGLAYSEKDEGLQYLLTGIEQINREIGTKYRVSWKVVNTADYGVPQIRERVFLVGSRDGRVFDFPDATHGDLETEQDLLFRTKEPRRTAWDALGDLAEPSKEELATLRIGGKWANLLPSIPEGENYLWHTNRKGGLPLFGWRTRYWSFLLKLSKRLPSWTIQAQPGASIGPFHWNNRKLSFKEMCRIQTFPDDLRLDCGRTETQRMLGNAVPSLVAEVLARAIRAQLLDSPLNRPLALLPPRRAEVPPAKRIKPVPEEYFSLLGEHEPHPGTGKGRSVQAMREKNQLEKRESNRKKAS